MKSKRVNLSILCVLSLILLVSNSLQAMKIFRTVQKNKKKLLLSPHLCIECNLKGVKFIDEEILQGQILQGLNFNS